MKKKYQIVNEQDKIIGYTNKEQAYKEKKLLRAVQIFVYNLKGELYIQKRGKNKKRFPGYLCSSTAGHVESGESYKKAAIRELKEELCLKINNKNLIFLGKEKIPVGNGNYSITTYFRIMNPPLAVD